MVTAMEPTTQQSLQESVIFQDVFSLGGQTTKLKGDMIGVITPAIFMSVKVILMSTIHPTMTCDVVYELLSQLEVEKLIFLSYYWPSRLQQLLPHRPKKECESCTKIKVCLPQLFIQGSGKCICGPRDAAVTHLGRIPLIPCLPYTLAPTNMS